MNTTKDVKISVDGQSGEVLARVNGLSSAVATTEQALVRVSAVVFQSLETN